MIKIPTKSKTSFDIPKLLSILEKNGPQDVQASWMAIATIRNWLIRHPHPKRLSATVIPGGYHVSLK